MAAVLSGLSAVSNKSINRRDPIFSLIQKRKSQ